MSDRILVVRKNSIVAITRAELPGEDHRHSDGWTNNSPRRTTVERN